MSSPDVSPAALAPSDGILFHTRKGKPREFPRPLAPLADTHGHVPLLEQGAPADVLARAALAGVRLVVVPVDPVEDRLDPLSVPAGIPRWLDGARRALEGYASLGLLPPDFGGRAAGLESPVEVRIVAGAHPYGAAGLDEAARSRLSALLDDPRCVGVGEFGLDYTCDVDRGIQEEAFREQLRIALDRGLPAELHIRDEKGDAAHRAHADALRVLAEEGLPEAGCDLHCFTDDASVMRPFVEMGCHVAFGGVATFRKSDDVRLAAVECPASRLLSETDCPYMAPEPLRGSECEPAMVCFSAARVAEERERAGIGRRQETYDALWDNARSLFGLAGGSVGAL